MKKILLSAILLVPFVLSAQDFDLDMDKPITSGIIGKSVLIVPYSSDMYNNQESRYIVEASKINYEQSINYFKASLDSAIVTSLKDSCKVISMLTNFTQSTSSDLEKIHSAASYKMVDRPAPVESKKKYDLFNPKFAKKKTSGSAPKNGIHNGEVVSTREDLSKKYMTVSFQDQDFINAMTLKYGVKYLMFITQFEILGDYSNPYTVAQKNYDRTIKAHYCIFDNTGKFIDGDYITHTFTAQEDKIVAICNDNFPHVAKKLVRKIP